MSKPASSLEPTLEHDVPMPSARSTGYVFTGVAVIVALIWRGNSSVWLPALTIAAGFAGLATLAPALLEPLNRLWFRFALLLNRIVSPVVMFVLFAVLITPFGLAMQVVRDPLRKVRPDDLDTCWVTRETPETPTSMRNQF
ncbi:MAG: hypothetical protein AAFQ45_15020 [Pseudomonadota bacterium]